MFSYGIFITSLSYNITSSSYITSLHLVKAWLLFQGSAVSEIFHVPINYSSDFNKNILINGVAPVPWHELVHIKLE